MPQSKALLRQSFGFFLHGSGIEIGALHQPLALKGLPISRIQYVDRFTVDRLRQHYPELSSYQFVPVEVLDDGETLAAFSDHSLDFIIANHFIEHARRLMDASYSIHFHTFVAGSFLEMLRYAREHLAVACDILAYAATPPESDEFLVILQK